MEPSVPSKSVASAAPTTAKCFSSSSAGVMVSVAVAATKVKASNRKSVTMRPPIIDRTTTASRLRVRRAGLTSTRRYSAKQTAASTTTSVTSLSSV